MKKCRVMRARGLLTRKSTSKAKARLGVLGFQDPDLTEVPTFCTGRGLDLTVRSVEQVEVGAMRHQHEGHCHIFILPLDDVRDVLKPTPESMLRLRKAVYGLVNAPKKCLDRLDR